jgi:transposase
MSIRSTLSRIYAQGVITQRTDNALGGRSIDDLLKSNLQLENEKLDLQRQLDVANERIAELEKLFGIHQARIIDLEKERERRKNKPLGANTPSSKEIFKKGAADENKKKNGGAKRGHKGVGRQSFKDEDVDITEIKALPESCHHCHCNEIGRKGETQRDIIDLSLDQVKNIRYRLEKGECLVCGSELSQKVQGVLPRSMFGNGLLAKIAVDHYFSGISLGTVLAQLRLGNKLPGIINAMHRLSKIASPSYDKIVADLRESPVLHADETSWRTDGDNGYAWGFFSKYTSVFVVGVSRAATTVKKILGEATLNGVLVVDRYAGYNKAPCEIQYCYAHLDRDVLEDREEFEAEEIVFQFLTKLSNLLKESMILRGKDITDENYLKAAEEIKTNILNHCSQGPPFEHAAIQYWRDFFNNNQNRLFHWTKSRVIPCENNKAEREIRRLVIGRKMSYGSQSAKGANTREILMTLLHTARKRLGPKDDLAVWLKDALDAYTRGDITDLYDALPPVVIK